jgi:O-antigen ligase
VGARRPASAAYALAFLAPLLAGVGRLFGAPVPLLLAFALPALGASFAVRRLRGEASPLPRSFLAWSLAFLAVEAASCVSSIVRGETIWRLLHGRPEPHYVNDLWMTSADRSRDAVLLFLGLVLLLAALDAFARLASDATSRIRLLSSAAAGGAIAFGWALVEHVSPPAGRGDYWATLGRRSGPFTDPNALGIGAALLAPVVLALLVERGAGRGAKGAGFAAALLLLPALQVSGSRSGFLLLGVAALVFLSGLVRARVLPMRVAGAGLVAILALLVAVWPFLPGGASVARGGLVSRLLASFRTGSLAAAANQRTVFWRGAFDVIAEEPLSGCGLAGFAYEFPVRFGATHHPVAFTDNPTNAILDVAAECGVPALLLALAIVVPLLVRAFETAISRDTFPTGARAAGAALVGLAVASMTGDHLRFPEVGVLAALVAAVLLRTGAAEGEPDPDFVPPKRTRAVLVIAGILASLAAVWPTRRPEAAFRAKPWIGLYRPEIRRKPDPHRWMAPVALRRVRPGETSLTLSLLNGRPDNRPVAVSVEVNGSPRPAILVPKGDEVPLTVGSLVPGQIVRLGARPTFVPGEGLLGRDDRTLGVMLRVPPGAAFP